jgi:putative DNA primase/helicase
VHDATAAEIVELALTKPELMVHSSNLPASAEALRDLFAASGKFFDRGVPVRIVRRADDSLPLARPLTNHGVAIEAHRLCQPVTINAKGLKVAITLPDRASKMYLDLFGEWNLPPLAGVTTSPLLSQDGFVRVADGYDPPTSLWCCGVPEVRISAQPSRADAEHALWKLRYAFRTFPFADSSRIWDAKLGVELIDLAKPPGIDESAFLVGLLTAVCRSSLWLAPALALIAAAVSGAGSGKGLLVRAICAIAFGTRPRAFTSGSEPQELDKRLAAELVEAQPVLFLDNVNGVALRSDTLASVLTERPARVRLLGVTRMVPLNSSAFIAITGNGLTLTEDLARRFITCELNAGCEDPESRPFRPGFLEEIEQKRGELLPATLTIWRWGRQNASQLPRGKPLGSFETWAEWCRDPLIALGCRDPIERVESIKAHDPRRQRIVEFFEAWWPHHGTDPVKASQLAEAVRVIADPQERGRQYVATFVARLAGTHAAGFVLSRQEGAGKWTAATYALKQAAAGHRTDRADQNFTGPNSHMGPMAGDVDAGVPPGAEAEV